MVRSQTEPAAAQPRFAGITSYCTVSVATRPHLSHMHSTAQHTALSSAISNKKTELQFPGAAVGLALCPVFPIKWALTCSIYDIEAASSTCVLT